ncbi:MAG: Hsp33 family molecular chaperone HslO [Rectinemataceae bacterium]|nr:Hsp33 family molecular chaperone HslO [Rectinemataceae bacterium]
MNIVPISDQDHLAHLDSILPDDVRTFSLGTIDGPAGGELRGAIVNGSRMVSQMRANHGLGIPETLVLGHAYMGAALMASTLKGEDRINIAVQCDGPAEGFSVEGRAIPSIGESPGGVAVRGRIFNNAIVLDKAPDSFDTAPFVGAGSITVVRHIEGMRQPFTGTTKLHSGRLSQDLAVYYLESEQTHTAFRFSIQFDRAGRVAGAGGIYLQAMPNALPETLSRAEERLAAMPTLGAWLAQGGDPDNLIEHYFNLLGPTMLARLDVGFDCPCSKERIGSFLKSSEPAFLVEMAEKGPWPIETTCHNCGSVYLFERDEIEAMRSQRSGD